MSPSKVSYIICKNLKIFISCNQEYFSDREVKKTVSENYHSVYNDHASPLEEQILKDIRITQMKESIKLKEFVFDIEELGLKKLTRTGWNSDIKKIDWVQLSYLETLKNEEINKSFESRVAKNIKRSFSKCDYSEQVEGNTSFMTSAKLTYISLKNWLFLKSHPTLRTFRGSSLHRNSSIFPILGSFIQSLSLFLIVLSFLVNLLVNASFITVPPVLLLLVFGMISYPFASPFFWKSMILYQVIVLMLKLIYHLPLFCLHKFAFSFSENCYSIQKVSSSSFFYTPEFLGFAKPQVHSMVGLLICDVLTLMALIFHRKVLSTKGIWDFLLTDLGKLKIIYRFTNQSPF